MSTKRKPPNVIAHPVVKQSAKIPSKTTINESETAVSIPNISKEPGITGELIEISSDSASSDYEYSDGEKEDGESTKLRNGAAKAEVPASQDQITPKNDNPPHNNDGDVDIDMAIDGESDQDPSQPTFGELARAHDAIEVPAAISTQPHAPAAPGRSLAPPSLSSLGTVLSQALRTDDSDLLESCLHTTDRATIRQTIERLDSSLATTLLTKIASRLHRRPGRAGSLMCWVQWTLIAHGGALATQAGLAKKLGELHRVLEERSRGLNSLLALKGKLDLLEAQMDLRRGMQRNRDPDEEDDEEGVVYVEGEESDADLVNGAMDMVEDNDELPVTNGVFENDSEDDEESSEGEEEGEDDLAVQDDLDENEVKHDDVESEEEDSEAEAAESQRPVKRSRTKRI
ncbi:NUC189-domain-containing protein [Hypoxylon fragiforme]|uniref:NUC189-domain-containing protein n=1 Tax=Hypoxylon fragiforme TaxID=63214 RepID=UPI0020C62178|nr:NUC189-domain-containing protein [Hypoxylon fragiforme]KAI2611674.1 NUC189-domain-containing protein [Hypoxylon fragiforme]